MMLNIQMYTYQHSFLMRNTGIAAILYLFGCIKGEVCHFCLNIFLMFHINVQLYISWSVKVFFCVLKRKLKTRCLTIFNVNLKKRWCVTLQRIVYRNRVTYSTGTSDFQTNFKVRLSQFCLIVVQKLHTSPLKLQTYFRSKMNQNWLLRKYIFWLHETISNLQFWTEMAVDRQTLQL